jgi:hypothetical protein
MSTQEVAKRIAGALGDKFSAAASQQNQPNIRLDDRDERNLGETLIQDGFQYGLIDYDPVIVTPTYLVQTAEVFSHLDAPK